MAKVYNDLLVAADKGDASALCLLDLSAAFDIDHDLLNASTSTSSSSGSVHICRTDHFRSCTEAARRLLRCGHYCLLCSLSQGSVLQGPRLFILYTADLADVAARHTTLTFIHTQMTLSYISAVSTRGHDDGYPTT